MSNRVHPSVITWLGSICVLTLVMVLLGGVTRLTGSGLSITEWKPIMGAIPPLNAAEWQEAFLKYQEIPQFKLVNSTMSLPEFKFIFFWEYFHRLFGRLIGFVFFVPAAYFYVTRKIDRTLALKFLVAFALGGAQGALGWFMVMSGLDERTSVSHFRLAAHLSLALALLGYVYWIYLDLRRGPAKDIEPPRGARAAFKAFTALVCAQIVYGAFVAGLKAGYAYNTFPKMLGKWIPDEAFSLSPFWMNALSNPAMVQFIHRTIAWSILVSAAALVAWTLRKASAPELRRASIALGAFVALQFVLGVSTLLLSVPVSLGAIHQLVGAILLLACLNANHALRRVQLSRP